MKEKGGPVEFEPFSLDGCHQISFSLQIERATRELLRSWVQIPPGPLLLIWLTKVLF